MEFESVKIPYLYFMDTQDLSDHCPVLGQSNGTYFEVVQDDKRKVFLLYKPADISGCTRSVVVFSQANNAISDEHFLGKTNWKFPEAHLFFVSDPSYFNKGADGLSSGAYYMTDFRSTAPLVHSVLLKFHELLGIAFSKIIGLGGAGYSALQFSAIFDEVAPWTITMAINSPLGKSGLTNTDASEANMGQPIDWKINYDKIKAKSAKGKHLFYVVQNRSDEVKYKNAFLKFKQDFQDNSVQGWVYQTPAVSFYNNSTLDHQNVNLSKDVAFDFLDWMSSGNPKARHNAGIYRLEREI
jgi:hypothetical protein